MAKQLSHLSRVPVRFETSGKPVPLDATVEYVVLMVAREAVYNAVRHAQPNEVRLSVHFEPSRMRMQVLDDGHGFDPSEAMASQDVHFGLVGMRERIESLGGRFEVKSAPGKGTQLAVEVPVQPAIAEGRAMSLNV
jgi:signal transduction histidine kinase